MTAGTAHIYFHNIWGTFPHALVSFLGWGLFAKGLLFLIAPNFVNRAGDGWAQLKLIPLAGTLMLLVGGVPQLVGVFGLIRIIPDSKRSDAHHSVGSIICKIGSVGEMPVLIRNNAATTICSDLCHVIGTAKLFLNWREF